MLTITITFTSQPHLSREDTPIDVTDNTITMADSDDAALRANTRTSLDSVPAYRRRVSEPCSAHPSAAGPGSGDNLIIWV